MDAAQRIIVHHLPDLESGGMFIQPGSHACDHCILPTTNDPRVETPASREPGQQAVEKMVGGPGIRETVGLPRAAVYLSAQAATPAPLMTYRVPLVYLSKWSAHSPMLSCGSNYSA